MREVFGCHFWGFWLPPDASEGRFLVATPRGFWLPLVSSLATKNWFKSPLVCSDLQQVTYYNFSLPNYNHITLLASLTGKSTIDLGISRSTQRVPLLKEKKFFNLGVNFKAY